jgi:voltage-gated potassium channel
VGADRVINPYVLGGMRLVVGVLKPDVLGFLDVVVDHRELEIELEQIRVSQSSASCGMTLAETDLPGHPKVILLSIKGTDGALDFNPAPDTVLTPGVTLITIGDQRAIGELRERLE